MLGQTISESLFHRAQRLSKIPAGYYHRCLNLVLLYRELVVHADSYPEDLTHSEIGNILKSLGTQVDNAMDLIKKETKKSKSKAYIEDAFNKATGLIETCIERLSESEAHILVQKVENAMKKATEKDRMAEENRTKTKSLLEEMLRQEASQKKKYVEFYFIPEDIYTTYETYKDQLCENITLYNVLALLLRFQHKSITVSLQRNPLFYDHFPYPPSRDKLRDEVAVFETTWKQLPLNSLAFEQQIGQLAAQNSESMPLMLFVLMDSDYITTATGPNSVSKKCRNRWDLYHDSRLLLKESNAAGTLQGILNANVNDWRFEVEKSCQVFLPIDPGRPSIQSAQSSSSGVTLVNDHPQVERDIIGFQSQKTHKTKQPSISFPEPQSYPSMTYKNLPDGVTIDINPPKVQAVQESAVSSAHGVANTTSREHLAGKAQTNLGSLPSQATAQSPQRKRPANMSVTSKLAPKSNTLQPEVAITSASVNNGSVQSRVGETRVPERKTGKSFLRKCYEIVTFTKS